MNDNEFINAFEKESGIGIKLNDLKYYLNKKKIKNFSLYKGDIQNTIDLYLNEHKSSKISLLHIDVDVYYPTKIILDKLFDKISKNGIILFDDYSIIDGETRAVNEFLENRKIKKKLKKIPFTKSPFFMVKNW